MSGSNDKEQIQNHILNLLNNPNNESIQNPLPWIPNANQQQPPINTMNNINNVPPGFAPLFSAPPGFARPQNPQQQQNNQTRSPILTSPLIPGMQTIWSNSPTQDGWGSQTTSNNQQPAAPAAPQQPQGLLPPPTTFTSRPASQPIVTQNASPGAAETAFINSLMARKSPSSSSGASPLNSDPALLRQQQLLLQQYQQARDTSLLSNASQQQQQQHQQQQRAQQPTNALPSNQDTLQQLLLAKAKAEQQLQQERYAQLQAQTSSSSSNAPSLATRSTRVKGELNAKQLSAIQSQLDNVHPAQKTAFDDTSRIGLQIIAQCVPDHEEERRRKETVARLQQILSKLFTHYESFELQLFGSSANAFAFKNGDLDLSLTLGAPTVDPTAARHTPQGIIKRIGRQMPRKSTSKKPLWGSLVKSLPHARTPVIKFIERESKIHCDITVNNILAVRNSRLIAAYCRVDKRFSQLGILIKYWARRRSINSSYDGTLSSYAYLLMVIVYLQTRTVPILPKLQYIGRPSKSELQKYLHDGWNTYYCEDFEAGDIEKIPKSLNDEDNCVENVTIDPSLNTSSLGSLLYGFFKFWTCDFDYENCVASPRLGSTTLTKAEKEWIEEPDKRERRVFCLEDPFKLEHNLGRVCDTETFQIIRDELRRATDLFETHFTQTQQALKHKKPLPKFDVKKLFELYR